MSIYKNVPSIADAASIEDLLDKSENVIRWGEMNLPEIRRAQAIAQKEKLSPMDMRDLALAMMIKSYVAAMEGWLECSQLNPTGIVRSI
jgi:hypothetical protein